MIQNTEEITEDTYHKGLEMAENVFQTEAHPDQMQAIPENFQRLKSLNPNTVLYEVINGDPVAWVVVVPTSRRAMDMFMKGEIGEQKLLEISEKQETYPALYLCAAATLPEYRRKGIALKLAKTAISRIPLTENYELYSWPTSKEGAEAIKKLEKETGRVIHIRK